MPGVVFRATALRADPFDVSLTTIGLGKVFLQTGRSTPHVAFARAVPGTAVLQLPLENVDTLLLNGRHTPPRAVGLYGGGAELIRSNLRDSSHAVLALPMDRAEPLLCPQIQLPPAPPGGTGAARGRRAGVGPGRRCHAERSGGRGPGSVALRRRAAARGAARHAPAGDAEPDRRGGRHRTFGRPLQAAHLAPHRRRGRRVPAGQRGAPDLHRGAVRGARHLRQQSRRRLPRHLRPQSAPPPEASPGHGAEPATQPGRSVWGRSSADTSRWRTGRASRDFGG
jgi:hypothetical protein